MLVVTWQDDVGMMLDDRMAVALKGDQLVLDPYKADKHYCQDCVAKLRFTAQRAPVSDGANGVR